MGYAVLVDISLCSGCRACVGACKHANGLPMGQEDWYQGSMLRSDYLPNARGGTKQPRLNANSFTVVQYRDTAPEADAPRWLFIKRQCMHCLHPACESACPVGAFEKLEQGPVTYHAERCMGCRYCMMACPFNVPTYQWDRPIPYVRKCTFCQTRILPGPGQPALRSQRQPACANACPTGALTFGKRSALLRDARRRIEDQPGRYVREIYGEHDAGGTSWLYISPVPFAKLGLPQNVGTKPYPEYTEAALGSVPPLIVGGGLLLAGVYILWKRKLELAAAEAAAGEPDQADKPAAGSVQR